LTTKTLWVGWSILTSIVLAAPCMAQPIISTTTHFVINWDDSETSQSWIDTIAQTAENVWTVEINNLNYQVPPMTSVSPSSNSEKVIITVENRAINDFGETDPVNPANIHIDNSYSAPGWDFTGVTALQSTLAHEFFHAVQFGYVDNVNNVASSDDLWFFEGTAAWMSDEVYPANLVYLKYPLAAPGFLQQPQISLTARNTIALKYGTSLFWKYLVEQQGGSAIQTIFVNIKNQNTFVGTPEILEAVGQTLGDPPPIYFGSNFASLFKKFSLACYLKTGPNGFKDNSASQLPNINPELPIDNTNDYYVAGFDPKTGIVTPNGARSLPPLAFTVLQFNKPASMTGPDSFTIAFDGVVDSNWGVDMVNTLNSNATTLSDISLDGNFRGSTNYSNFGGSDPSGIQQSVLIPSRLINSGNAVTYNYRLAFSEPPILSAATIVQNGVTKYQMAWSEQAGGRTMNVSTNKDIDSSVDASFTLDFSEQVDLVSVQTDGGVALAGNLDGSHKEWTGSLTTSQMKSTGFGDTTLVISAVNNAGNSLDGDPSTVATFNPNTYQFDGYDDQDGNDTHIGGNDTNVEFNIIGDTTPPTLQYFDQDGDPFQPNTDAVSILATDTGSGVSSTTVTSPSGSPVTPTSNVATTTSLYSTFPTPVDGTYGVTSCDNAGNCTTGSFTIDTNPCQDPTSQSCKNACDQDPNGQDCQGACGANPASQGCQDACSLSPNGNTCQAACDADANSQSCQDACALSPDGNVCLGACNDDPDSNACLDACQKDPTGPTCTDTCSAHPTAAPCQDPCRINPNSPACQQECDSDNPPPECPADPCDGPNPPPSCGTPPGGMHIGLRLRSAQFGLQRFGMYSRRELLQPFQL